MSVASVEVVERRQIPRGQKARAIWPVYLVGGLGSHGGNLVLVGIFFFTTQQFHWTLRQNLMLAAGEGVFCVAGALSTARVSRYLSRSTLLMLLQTGMLAIALSALVWTSPWVVTPLLLVYVMLSTAGWPALESLVSQDVTGHQLSRRLAIYNLVWSAVNAGTLAISGIVIERRPGWVFGLVAIAHVAALATVWFSGIGRESYTDDAALSREHQNAKPEQELLQQRSLALWLSRISLPSTYVIVYSLSAMMPTLAVLAPLSVRQRTLVSSTWFISRCLAFGVLGVTTFWHTRPRLLLWAVGIMGVAFLGICVRMGDLLPIGHSTAVDLPIMIAWQLVLGVTIAVIYAASLYFGMVLSEGSTDHAGYHEALIGLGSIVGPAAAAGVGACFPGRPGAGIATVAVLVAMSFVAAAVRAAKTKAE